MKSFVVQFLFPFCVVVCYIVTYQLTGSSLCSWSSHCAPDRNQITLYNNVTIIFYSRIDLQLIFLSRSKLRFIQLKKMKRCCFDTSLLRLDQISLLVASSCQVEEKKISSSVYLIHLSGFNWFTTIFIVFDSIESEMRNVTIMSPLGVSYCPRIQYNTEQIFLMSTSGIWNRNPVIIIKAE